MSINELFEHLNQDNYLETLNGELTKECNCIIWSYDLINDCEEIEAPIDTDDETFAYEALSPEELLQEAYDEDLISIKEFIAEMDDFTDWSFSDPEIGDTTISFKIF